MDVRNRVTRLTLSENGAGNQPQAQTGEIAQEAKVPGKARGYADVGADNRKVKVLAEVTSYATSTDADGKTTAHSQFVSRAHPPGLHSENQ
jgi:hypothetical protein